MDQKLLPPAACFVLRALTLFAIFSFAAPAAHALVDTDGDLMPDAWETSFGFNPRDAADADLDRDNDRMSNRDEYFAVTNPIGHMFMNELTELQLLRLFEGKAFLYFWEQSRAPYYFTPDSANFDNKNEYSDNFNSIAATGFAMMSYAVADERGWVDHQEAYNRVLTLLTRLTELQSPAYDVFNPADPLPNPPLQNQANRHGYFYHFVDNNGFRLFGSEISTVDHALLVAGALFAGEYYKGTEVEALAEQLYLNTDWNWLWNGTYLWQGWFEDPARGNFGAWEGGSVDDLWNRYSELMMLMFLAMGHPDGANAIPNSTYPNAWDQLSRDWGNNLSGVMFPREYASLYPGASPPNTAPQSFGFVPNLPSTLEANGYSNSNSELHYIHAGSLHNHQYSHLYVDFRKRKDGYQTDYFANSIAATLVNRQYCINLNLNAYGGDPNSSDPYLQQPYETYGSDLWGLMAGNASYGYAVLAPIVIAGEDFSPVHLSRNNDSGTVVLNAALGSTPFAPRQVIDMARNLLIRYQNREAGYDYLIGRYGFRNAVNLGRTDNGQLGHFPSATLGLDLGSIVGNVENHLSGLVWKYLMRNPYVQRGMQAAGFNTGHVEPFVLNFDDPPYPHEDPNGGGVDPHSFGGSTFTFGNSSSAYLAITDPFPAQNYGPQGWVQHITTADNNDSGVFFTLNNHSVSDAGRISFWIRGAVGGEDFKVGLKDSVVDYTNQPLSNTEVKVSIADYHPAGQITNQWTEVRIPLDVFRAGGVRLTALDNLSFTNQAPGGGEIFIDDIAFLPDEFAPAAPQNFSAYLSGADAVLNWTESPEADVVGYKVLRRALGAGSYSQLNGWLLVGNTFTDSAVPHGAFEYSVSAVDNALNPNTSTPAALQTIIVNNLPVINPLADKAVASGVPVSYNVVASDTDGDALTLRAELGNGAALNTIGASFTDSGNNTGSFNWTPTAQQEGAYTFKFIADDGLQTAVRTVLVTVGPENIPPTVTIQTPADGIVIPWAALNFAGTATDASGVTEVRVYVYDWVRKSYTVANAVASYNSGAGTWSYAVPASAISQGGTATFWVRAKDTNGNWSIWQQNTVGIMAAFVDVSPPVITVVAPHDGDTFLLTGGSFHGTIADESSIADVRVYVYDWARSSYTAANVQAAFDPNSGDWSFAVVQSMLTAGRNATLWVRAKDAAGNWSTWKYVTVSVETTIADTTPPVVAISSPVENVLFSANGGLFAGTVTDASAIAEVRVYVYDTARATFTVNNELAAYDSNTSAFSFNVTAAQITPNKNVTLWVRAKDEHGNWSLWQQRTVTVEQVVLDVDRPVVTISMPGTGSDFPAAGGAFNGSIADASPIADVRIYVYDSARRTNTVVNEQAVFNAAGAWSYQVQAAQITAGSDATLWVRAQDTAGNWSVWAESTVHVN